LVFKDVVFVRDFSGLGFGVSLRCLQLTVAISDLPASLKIKKSKSSQSIHHTRAFGMGGVRLGAEMACYAFCRLRSVKPIKGRHSVMRSSFFLFFVFLGVWRLDFRFFGIIKFLNRMLSTFVENRIQ
jgi:hypothetical protein